MPNDVSSEDEIQIFMYHSSNTIRLLMTKLWLPEESVETLEASSKIADTPLLQNPCNFTIKI
jgi:hypothetical protein